MIELIIYWLVVLFIARPLKNESASNPWALLIFPLIWPVVFRGEFKSIDGDN